MSSISHTNLDPREIPAYGIGEAAHYLGIPKATLRAWTLGQAYRVAGDSRYFRPVIRIADRDRRLLSFLNLVEAHILEAIRRQHHVSLQKVRTTLGYLARQFPSRHPLADHAFESDGLSLFVEKYGTLIDATREGQTAMRQVLETYLSRIERDLRGEVIRLYPFTRRREPSEPKYVVIDPRVQYGRPVLVGTGIPTSVIADRLKGGETIDELARDYERSPAEIEEAIRCELKTAA